jgi:hypothetical protein
MPAKFAKWRNEQGKVTRGVKIQIKGEILSQEKWKVDIVESEAGWGSKVDETKEFPSEQKAKDFVKKYNEKYNPPLKPGERVPSWYMIATTPYRVFV